MVSKKLHLIIGQFCHIKHFGIFAHKDIISILLFVWDLNNNDSLMLKKITKILFFIYYLKHGLYLIMMLIIKGVMCIFDLNSERLCHHISANRNLSLQMASDVKLLNRTKRSVLMAVMNHSGLKCLYFTELSTEDTVWET